MIAVPTDENPSQPDEIDFLCPECGTHLSVPAELAGTRGSCIGCSVVIVAPDMVFGSGQGVSETQDLLPTSSDEEKLSGIAAMKFRPASGPSEPTLQSTIRPGSRKSEKPVYLEDVHEIEGLGRVDRLVPPVKNKAEKRYGGLDGSVLTESDAAILPRKSITVSLRTLLAVCAAMIMFCMGVVWFLLPSKESRTVEDKIEIEEPVDEAPVFSQTPKLAAESFVAATLQAERLKWARNPGEVVTHFSSYPKQALDAPVEKLVPMGLANNGDHIFARFMASFADGGKRLVCVVPTPEGSRVDWDCYARYCTATWPQLLANEVTTADVRVFAKPANYYNFSYQDDSKWSCYILTSPELDKPVYAYAERSSKAGKILNQSLSNRKKPAQRITISISTTEQGATRRQITINRIRAIGWVVGDKDLNDTWVEPFKENDTKLEGSVRLEGQ